MDATAALPSVRYPTPPPPAIPSLSEYDARPAATAAAPADTKAAEAPATATAPATDSPSADDDLEIIMGYTDERCFAEQEEAVVLEFAHDGIRGKALGDGGRIMVLFPDKPISFELRLLRGFPKIRRPILKLLSPDPATHVHDLITDRSGTITTPELLAWSWETELAVPLRSAVQAIMRCPPVKETDVVWRLGAPPPEVSGDALRRAAGDACREAVFEKPDFRSASDLVGEVPALPQPPVSFPELEELETERLQKLVSLPPGERKESLKALLYVSSVGLGRVSEAASGRCDVLRQMKEQKERELEEVTAQLIAARTSLTSLEEKADEVGACVACVNTQYGRDHLIEKLKEVRKDNQATLDALNKDLPESGGFDDADCLYFRAAKAFHLADQKIRALQRAP